MDHRRRAEAHGLVHLGTLAPNQLAVGGIERVEPAGQIAEEQHVTAVERRRDDAGANRAVGLKHPLEAAGRGAQRVHEPAGAPDEHLVADDRRLAERGDVTVEAERPLQLQPWHLARRQLRQFGRHET